MRSPVIPILLALSLTGCATEPSKPPAVCPVIKSYTASQMAEAAKELTAAPAGAELPAMISDYQAMRDEARVCAGKAVPGP